MEIKYVDADRLIWVTVPEELLESVQSIGYNFMIQPSEFNLIVINLRSDSSEEAEFWLVKQPQSRRVASMGGASAWNLYKQLAQLFPQINYHFRANR